MDKNFKQHIINVISRCSYGYQKEVALAIMGVHSITRNMFGNLAIIKGEFTLPMRFIPDGVIIPVKQGAMNINYELVMGLLKPYFNSYAYLSAHYGLCEDDVLVLTYNERLRNHVHRFEREKVTQVLFSSDEERYIHVHTKCGSVIKIDDDTDQEYTLPPHLKYIYDACNLWLNYNGEPVLADNELVHDANKILSSLKGCLGT